MQCGFLLEGFCEACLQLKQELVSSDKDRSEPKQDKNVYRFEGQDLMKAITLSTEAVLFRDEKMP